MPTRRVPPASFMADGHRRRLFLRAAINHPHPTNSDKIQKLIKQSYAYQLTELQPELTQLGYWPQVESELARRQAEGQKDYHSYPQDHPHRRNYFHHRYLQKKATKLGLPVEELIRQEEQQEQQKQQAATQQAKAPTPPKPKKLCSLKQLAYFQTDLKTLQKHKHLAARALCQTALQNIEKDISFKEDYILDSIPEALLVLKELEPDYAAAIYPRLRIRFHSYNVYQQRLNGHLKPQAQPYKTTESSPTLPGE